ncbi:unnamed protein product [Lepeophtheirus salmonis]|uniref:(salmon louse) hypothetical protein n=1 Tax=Lepeophtheirus salmonis TaxID=72036 RepID=A0A7R8CUW4_LEPSM|nr:unnamed protein product [Lepeophtheirus salmonis]CAF2938320.1 unnamed protein product [Lepeophtheirus salmonis]
MQKANDPTEIQGSRIEPLVVKIPILQVCSKSTGAMRFLRDGSLVSIPISRSSSWKVLKSFSGMIQPYYSNSSTQEVYQGIHRNLDDAAGVGSSKTRARLLEENNLTWEVSIKRAVACTSACKNSKEYAETHHSDRV